MALQLETKPWRHWFVVYAVLLTYFFVYRCVAFSAMLHMFGTEDERTVGNALAAFVLGFCEDVVLVTLLLVLLSLVDTWVGPQSSSCLGKVWLRRGTRAFLHTLLVVLAVLSFGADMLLIRSRTLRFTFAFIENYFREFKFTAGFEVAPREVHIAYETVVVTSVVVASLVGVSLQWLDFSQWHLAKLLDRDASSKPTTYLSLSDVSKIECGGLDETESPTSSSSDSDMECDVSSPVASPAEYEFLTTKQKRLRVARNVGVPVAFLVVSSTLLLAITHAVPAVVSAAALNDSLNELFRLTMKLEFLKSLGDGTIESADAYLDRTSESYELFRSDVLFRNTTGFNGPLAFDVAVDQQQPPNVVVIAVESFRFQDSLYLVGDNAPAIRKKQGNVTLTPNFDRWAQRGVAFRNFWSTWQTSRSVEGILFGQVPFDHVSDSGTTAGRKSVELNGMPQLFTRKGYETAFTTGARLNYDGWNKFFGFHGFDSVVGAADMRVYAQQHYNISEKDWALPEDGGQGRAMYWGVHDDVSFEYLGDFLMNKTTEQQARVAAGEAKKPVFVNHYTISSHTSWQESPAWFDKEPLPDFHALYDGLGDYTVYTKAYAKMRYFSDLQLGKFLDRMQREGVLNDTIVVITGDHGQSPELRQTRPYTDEITTTRVPLAIVAEGRLAKHAGLVFNDAAAHHDLLNTVADIVGVPNGGFLQSGVGRSLKRAPPPTPRPVWSNNPMLHLAVVKGHLRLSYDRLFSEIGLFDAEADPMQTTDLFPSLPTDEQSQWKKLREQGRRLSRYFRLRWERACISKVDC